MKNKLRRLAALILVMVMSLSLLSAEAWAAEDASTVGSDGSASTVEVQPTTLSISQTTLTLYAGKDVSLKATVQPEGNAVAWSSSNSSVATVDSNGKVTAIKAGNCSITARVDNVSASCSVTVKKPTIRLKVKSLSLNVKKTTKLEAFVDGPNKRVIWKSSNTKIASVNKNGILTAKKTGSCTVTATANGVSVKCKVNIIGVKQQAVRVYKDVLTRYSSRMKEFALVYLDDNDIPEMIVRQDTGYRGEVHVYSYGNGLGRYWAWEDGKEFKYYKKKAIFVVSDPLETQWYYRFIETGQAFKTLAKYGDGAFGSYSKYGDASIISKSKFQKALKKKVGTTKPSKPSFHKNTKSNRNKYLK